MAHVRHGFFSASHALQAHAPPGQVTTTHPGQTLRPHPQQSRRFTSFLHESQAFNLIFDLAWGIIVRGDFK